MNQRRRKFADFFAMGCGALALVGWGLAIDAMVYGAIAAGVSVLIWSMVTR